LINQIYNIKIAIYENIRIYIHHNAGYDNSKRQRQKAKDIESSNTTKRRFEIVKHTVSPTAKPLAYSN
jgi:hypothetical protein